VTKARNIDFFFQILLQIFFYENR